MLEAAKARPLTKKVGIFSGTFDPVHAGHISFALKAAEQASLDKIYFLPERSPRRKDGVTHYAHRVAMLRLALRPYPQFDVLELPDKQFSVARTLPRLRKILGDVELHQLIGSDMLELLASAEAGQQWPGIDIYLQTVRLIVGARHGREAQTEKCLKDVQPNGLITSGHMSDISSSTIRLAVQRGKIPDELLRSIRAYVRQNWLYESVAS